MKLLFSFTCLLLLTTCSTTEPSSTTNIPERPNILFIFTDDQAYDAIGALGDGQVITPNLDRLVNSGTTFTHAYNMGAWQPAVCLASRAMINSGRSVWQAQRMTERWRAQDQEAMDQNWAPLMRAAGYQTYFTGKWHVDAPATDQFDRAANVRPGMPHDGYPFPVIDALRQRHNEVVPIDSLKKYWPAGYNRPLHPTDDSWSPTDTSYQGFYAGGRHWSEVVADDAEIFLGEVRNADAPFFMYLAFNAPHDPRQAPQAYQDLYNVEDITVPASFLPRYPHANLIGNGSGMRDEDLAPYPRTELAVKTHRKEYYASISHLDAQVGRILRALSASGVKDNTIIIFTADHGLAVGNHGFIGKQNLYDHSVRVPLIVVGPGIEAGRKIDTDVYLQDVMPTALSLAGVEQPDYVYFNSLLPLLQDDAPSPYPAIYGAYVDYARSIRKDGYKLIVYPKAKVQRLYNVAEDPRELRDLIALEPEKAAALLTDLRALQAELGDDLSLTW
ncbi:sulfatase-like hydrolase/transferase [Lewinella sp. 4G2]|uniref:sulfatase-like hydrolase/transferase n=1 Tax=Lewinella sp. 4G2 TaxID=1803372 RepID=UPI0007B4746C|nr:sulfatase-like hydrolase/transferase [Lewinella sp. 4G2]OAV44424.1 choline-sulfatase [Lewinella sp. 4G2]